MSSPLSQSQLDIYGRLHALAGNFEVRFNIGNIGLLEREYSDADRIFDTVDGIYEEGVEKEDLDYGEVRVLATIAVLRAAEFRFTEDPSSGGRSFDG